MSFRIPKVISGLLKSPVIKALKPRVRPQVAHSKPIFLYTHCTGMGFSNTQKKINVKSTRPITLINK